jgi:hypothetical protein
MRGPKSCGERCPACAFRCELPQHRRGYRSCDADRLRLPGGALSARGAGGARRARLPPWVVRVASRVLRRIRQRGVTPAAAASSHRGLLGHVQPGPRSACGISSSAAGSTGSKSICSRPSRRSERNRLKGCPSPKQDRLPATRSRSARWVGCRYVVLAAVSRAAGWCASDRA